MVVVQSSVRLPRHRCTFDELGLLGLVSWCSCGAHLEIGEELLGRDDEVV